MSDCSVGGFLQFPLLPHSIRLRNKAGQISVLDGMSMGNRSERRPFVSWLKHWSFCSKSGQFQDYKHWSETCDSSPQKLCCSIKCWSSEDWLSYNRKLSNQHLPLSLCSIRPAGCYKLKPGVQRFMCCLVTTGLWVKNCPWWMFHVTALVLPGEVSTKLIHSLVTWTESAAGVKQDLLIFDDHQSAICSNSRQIKEYCKVTAIIAKIRGTVCW